LEVSDGDSIFRLYTGAPMVCYVNTIYDFSRTLEVRNE
jgi:hypothetical protein